LKIREPLPRPDRFCRKQKGFPEFLGIHLPPCREGDGCVLSGTEDKE
jgi:hypothetical protein